jgi:hypothetical protein
MNPLARAGIYNRLGIRQDIDNDYLSDTDSDIASLSPDTSESESEDVFSEEEDDATPVTPTFVLPFRPLPPLRRPYPNLRR